MWAKSSSAKGFNEVNLSNQIQLFIDQKIASFSDLNQIADNVGIYKIKFLIEDPRVLENPNWQSILSDDQEFDLEVVKTLPTISFKTPEPYRLADPEGEFLQWEKILLSLMQKDKVTLCRLSKILPTSRTPLLSEGIRKFLAIL